MSRLGTRYVTGKVAGALGSLAFMLVFNFFLFRVLPGDPVRTLARNRLVSEKQMDELTRTLGLDEPLPVQFLTYLKNTFTGEFQAGHILAPRGAAVSGNVTTTGAAAGVTFQALQANRR